MKNIKLKDKFIDEKTGIEYIRNGDYYLPNLVLADQKKIQLNKYGHLRLEYLKKHKKAEYTILFMDNKLIDHLEEVQETASKRVEEIIQSLKEKSNLTEEMKNTDQLYWVGMMNNFKNQAEEIVLKELIYEKEPIQKILITLYNHFKKLYIVKIAEKYRKDLAVSMKLKPNQMFLVNKYKMQARYFTEKEIRQILQELINLDANYKIGLIDINVGLEAILCRYCS